MVAVAFVLVACPGIASIPQVSFSQRHLAKDLHNTAPMVKGYLHVTSKLSKQVQHCRLPSTENPCRYSYMCSPYMKTALQI